MPIPPRPVPPVARRTALALGLAWVVAGPRRAAAQDAPGSMQVTLFGVVATPNSKVIDPKLASIAPQLRRLLPNHGFRLVDARSKRLHPGDAIACDLKDGSAAEAQLIQPAAADGKIRLRFALTQGGVPQFATVVATPPNQLFFYDRPHPDGSRMLIGIGAR